jgi:nucleotide-binding universal stress UspA family protein
MTLNTIVSYDGTDNDRDALSLARVFGEAGANLVLAYVCHSNRELGEHDAEALLERGVTELDGLSAETRVTVHGSTSEGLKVLAEREGAQLIVFGSAYRTPTGRVELQKSTQSLLDGGPAAIAIAPAGYHQKPIRTIGLLAGLDDHAAIDTAHALATHFEATVTDATYNVDLLIVGSRPEAPEGRALISAVAEIAIEESRSPVLVIARGVALSLPAPLYVG